MQLSTRVLYYVAESFVESDNRWYRQLHAHKHLTEAADKITKMNNLELLDLIGEFLKEEAINDD